MESFEDFLRKEGLEKAPQQNHVKQNYLPQLNKPQKEAVTQKDGAMLVVAGAGSGKTRVITARMAHLIIEQQVDPRSIIALTFTNKAAGEMKARLTNFLASHPPAGGMPFIGTFHSYCLLLLKSNPSLLPFSKDTENTTTSGGSSFSILDEDDQRALLKKIIKKHNLEKQFSPKQISYQISKIKNSTIDASTSSRNHSDLAKISQNDSDFGEITPLFKDIYFEYETEKAKAHSFDFDDLLLTVLQIFLGKIPTTTGGIIAPAGVKNLSKNIFKEKFQSRIRHILVDEYQDTNAVQHELLKEMALDDSKFTIDSLCAVGDEDQSIYSWRGAMVTNMLSFQKDFAPVKMIKIEQNYRS